MLALAQPVAGSRRTVKVVGAFTMAVTNDPVVEVKPGPLHTNVPPDTVEFTRRTTSPPAQTSVELASTDTVDGNTSTYTSRLVWQPDAPIALTVKVVLAVGVATTFAPVAGSTTFAGVQL